MNGRNRSQVDHTCYCTVNHTIEHFAICLSVCTHLKYFCKPLLRLFTLQLGTIFAYVCLSVHVHPSVYISAIYLYVSLLCNGIHLEIPKVCTFKCS